MQQIYLDEQSKLIKRIRENENKPNNDEQIQNLLNELTLNFPQYITK